MPEGERTGDGVREEGREGERERKEERRKGGREGSRKGRTEVIHSVINTLMVYFGVILLIPPIHWSRRRILTWHML